MVDFIFCVFESLELSLGPEGLVPFRESAPRNSSRNPPMNPVFRNFRNAIASQI